MLSDGCFRIHILKPGKFSGFFITLELYISWNILFMETILVVDDDVTFTQILQVFLKKCGYSVDVAHNVTDAARILDKETYQLYLFDYRLPDGTGLDIMSIAMNRNKRVPTIIMTGLSKYELQGKND